MKLFYPLFTELVGQVCKKAALTPELIANGSVACFDLKTK